MLQKTDYTTAPEMTQKRVITGQWIGKAKLTKRQLAELAALWLAGEIEVKPTAAMAAVLFRVSKPYITAATADLRKAKAAKKQNGGNGNGHNGNGHGHDYVVVREQLPFIPSIDDVWSHLTDDEREAFVRGHAPFIWSAFDHITA